ncbi:beta-lactamase family protein [Amycolatopsis sulphurea]|uniref:Beta-lactamase family protein n=1 Tax=Amycolatopsis sulphurea TaxID=76022 RepID=A0A2A9FI13_9PSEU|nr:beta-lactamase family protein [Amycolatopsis sulphurea]
MFGARKRGLLGAVVLGAAAATGCGTTPAAPDHCPTTAPPDVATVIGWTGYIAAHRDDVSLVVDDGRGTRVVNRPDQPQPLASAVKVVTLAAYGRAVAQGRVRPDEPFRVGDWERWFLPDTDGGAHVRALDLAGIAHDRVRALDPQRVVPLDQLVTSMIQVSDNAAADFLRDRLGDEALRQAAADGGWPNLDLPAEVGGIIALYAPELAPPLTAPRSVRALAEWALARRYATDPVLRADLLTRPLPPQDFERQWSDSGAAASAQQLAALHRAIATGSFGPGTDIARTHLEHQPSTLPDVTGIGYKGGSLNGVLTGGIELRRDDGTIASAALLVRRMQPDEQSKASSPENLLIAAMTDPAVMARLHCSV